MRTTFNLDKEKDMIRMARPAHPGQFIRMEVLEPYGLSVTTGAEALGVTRAALSALVNGRSDLSPDMALRVEKAFGVKIDTLMRMQASYDIGKAHADECIELDSRKLFWRLLGRLDERLRLWVLLFLLHLFSGLPEEQVRADRRPEHGDHYGEVSA